MVRWSLYILKGKTFFIVLKEIQDWGVIRFILRLSWDLIQIKRRLSVWSHQPRRRRSRKLLLPANCRNKTGVKWNHFLSSSPGSTNLFMYFFTARCELTSLIPWTYLPSAWKLCIFITSVMFSHLNPSQMSISIGTCVNTASSSHPFWSEHWQSLCLQVIKDTWTFVFTLHVLIATLEPEVNRDLIPNSKIV